MNDEQPLTRAEFLTHVGYLREDVKGVNDRLDIVNGRTRAVENKVSVLEDRSDESKRDGMRWGGAAGALIGGMMTALYNYFHHGGN